MRKSKIDKTKPVVSNISHKTNLKLHVKVTTILTQLSLTFINFSFQHVILTTAFTVNVSVESNRG